MGMKTLIDQKTNHMRIIRRKEVNLMYQVILMLWTVMLNGE